MLHVVLTNRSLFYATSLDSTPGLKGSMEAFDSRPSPALKAGSHLWRRECCCGLLLMVNDAGLWWLRDRYNGRWRLRRGGACGIRVWTTGRCNRRGAYNHSVAQWNPYDGKSVMGWRIKRHSSYHPMVTIYSCALFCSSLSVSFCVTLKLLIKPRNPAAVY